MINRGKRGNCNGRRSQGNGYYQGAGKPGSSAKRRGRRRIRAMKAVITWAVYILPIGLIAVDTFRAVSSVASSKKRQMRQGETQRMASRDYAEATEDFDAALEKSGKRSKGFNSDVLIYRAETRYKFRDYETSVHTYNLLLGMEPSTASYLYVQSMCCSQMGDTENTVAKYQAGAALEKDAKASAEKMEALMAADGAYVDAKECEEAMGFYQGALKEGTKHGQIYNQMGPCQMAEEDYQGALDSFKQGYETLMTRYELSTGASAAQAAATLPEDTSSDIVLLKELTYNRAMVCEYLNRYQKALELFEEYVTTFDSNENAEHEVAFLKTR